MTVAIQSHFLQTSEGGELVAEIDSIVVCVHCQLRVPSNFNVLDTRKVWVGLLESNDSRDCVIHVELVLVVLIFIFVVTSIVQD